MAGYPFFYVNQNLDQDEKFMVFSIDPIPEDSELNVTQVASFPIILEPYK